MGCPIGKDGNSALSLGQSFGAVFLCSNYFLLLHKSVNGGILKMKKDNRPQGGLPGELGVESHPDTCQSI